MREEPVRAAFVYANPRAELAREVEAGTAPDTGLLGQNHLAELGIDATVHDPLLTRREWHGAAHRLTWHLRELVLPFELGGVDVVCTPLANLLPLTTRLRRVRTVVVNYGLNLIVLRASSARRRLLRASLGVASSVVCLGERQREELLELTGLPEDHVHTALFGVDEQFFDLVPQPADGYVLSVGRDLARDYRTLAQAVEGLDARVVVVAEPRNLDGVRLPANVETRRGLAWTELRDLYAGAACVVIPMQAEGYRYGSEASGLTAFLEAAASGRAVIATDRSVLRDYLEPEVSGVTVPAGEPEGAARGSGAGSRRPRSGGTARRRCTRERGAELDDAASGRAPGAVHPDSGGSLSMRVGLSLLTLVPGVVGGSERYARELAKALARVGELEYRAFVPTIAPDAADGLPSVVVPEYRASTSMSGRIVAMSRASLRPGRLLRRLDARRRSTRSTSR